MDWVQIFSFIVVATLLVISPGPNGVLIAKTVPVSGKSAGFANIAGFVSAFYVHGSLSILGISILLVQSAQAFFIFKICGAAYLCWIGVKSLLAAWQDGQQDKQIAMNTTPAKDRVSMRSAFYEGFLTNALNPKVSMFYLAAFPQFMPASGELVYAYFLVFLHSFLNLIWFSAMVLFVHRVKQVAYSSRISRWLKSFTGLIFIGFGAKLASLKP